MKHILAVDDSASNLQMVKNSLRSSYNVTLVNNGERALSYLEKKRPDLILLDIMMPGLDGVETLTEIKKNQEWKDIPVVMVTAGSDPSAVADCRMLGATDIITKPFMPRRLVNSIEKAMAAPMAVGA